MSISVLIIESPGLIDITTEDNQGKILAQELRLLRIHCEYKPIHTSSLLQQTLNSHAKYDVIHICCHGSKDGLSFTDGSFLNWDALQSSLLPFMSKRLVMLSACQSAFFKPDATLAKFLQQISFDALKAPKCIFTMFGNFYFADGVLAWGVFYRKFSEELEKNKASVSSCTSRMILNSLRSVKNAELPSVKICAAYWYEQSKRYIDISPWKIGEQVVDAIEKGLPIDDNYFNHKKK
ncbi:MAG: CHAT domain-containing protein [Planctomycetota bacterium]